VLGGHELVRRYEDLRSWALGNAAAASAARGLAVLLRRGVPAWMQAWRQFTQVKPAPSQAPSAPITQTPLGVGLEVARVLANMVLFGRGLQA
jgi:hypothetical protein